MVVPETRLPWLVFGDGSQGQLLEKKDIGPDEDGVHMSKSDIDQPKN